MLADDFVEDVQAIVVGILSGNLWGLVYSTGAGNVKEVRPLTTSVKTSGQESTDLRAAKKDKAILTTRSDLVVTFCSENVFPECKYP